MTALKSVPPHSGAAAHVPLEFVHGRRFRPADDAQRHGLVGVAAQALDLEVSVSFLRFAFVFGTTFSVLYVIVLAKDMALFTVFPSLGVVLAGTHRSRDVAAPAMAFLAPAIYWYGWVTTAALGALTFGFVAALLPGQWQDRSG